MTILNAGLKDGWPILCGFITKSGLFRAKPSAPFLDFEIVGIERKLDLSPLLRLNRLRKNPVLLRARLHRLRKNPVLLKGTASQAAEKPRLA
jgi:hypothetical protein